jgi:capsular polysaccharide biosynthesis protein
MRNYSQSRTNYESLLAKKLQSQMATNLEKRQEGEQFRILDPPSYPERPYFPQRLRFALGGLVAGILLGAALSIGFVLLNPRVYREQDITALGQMVIGTVPPLPTVTELQTAARHRRMEWVFATLAIVTIPVATLVTYLKS